VCSLFLDLTYREITLRKYPVNNAFNPVLRSTWAASLIAIIFGSWFSLTYESLRIPWSVYWTQPNLWPAALSLGLNDSLEFLLIPVGGTLAFTGTFFIPKFRFRRPIGALLIVGVVTAVTYYIYNSLIQYEPFRGYLPFVLFFVLFAIGLSIGYAMLDRAWIERSDTSRKIGWLVGCVGLVGFGTTSILNDTLYKGLYPTLHLSSHQTAYVLLHCGLLHVLVNLLNRVPRSRTWLVAFTLLVSISLFSVASFSKSATIATVRPLYTSFTVLGQSGVVKQSYDMSREDKLKTTIVDDPAALKRFIDNANFPELPDGFSLKDFNVLFIMIEAFRFDQTSLFLKSLNTTPNLVKLAERGAFVFKRAYSPSSGTVHSLASFMTMTYPSHARIETWQRAWYGELDKRATTIAELFSASGYQTTRISHNHYACFINLMLGFGQGFARTHFVEQWTTKDNKKTDRELADYAVRLQRKRVGSDAKYFDWIFFASPHSPYIAHYPDWPAKNDFDCYRQEIRFVDEQLGRLFRAMDANGVFDTTIVIITGDHGEEFGEHGGSHHKATVYSEVIRVPLVMWIPGIKGSLIKKPTSTMYTFPWLFLHHDEMLRTETEKIIRNEIGPMMRATDGAVIIELVGHDRMQSSLVYETHKVNYDFITQRLEVFDLRTDPSEQRNLLFTSSGIASRFSQKINRYRIVRASHRRMTLAPKRRPQ